MVSACHKTNFCNVCNFQFPMMSVISFHVLPEFPRQANATENIQESYFKLSNQERKIA